MSTSILPGCPWPLASDLDWFLPAPSDLDLARPEYALLSSIIGQSRDNACALDVTATADMTAIPYVYPQSGSLTRYYLMKGRWLDREDDLAGNRAIVIHQGLADARNLKVGDAVTLKLRDAAFFDPYTRQTFAPLSGYRFELQPVGHEFPAQTETFEIVGIYRSLDPSSIGTFDSQRAYIPLSVFPASFPPAISPDETEIYSIVLDSPAHEEAFQEATQSDLAGMGYTVTFMENGYRSFKSATEGIRAAAWSNVLIFGGIAAVCFCLAAFVYFRFRQKDLAISRALGVPVGRCVVGSAPITYFDGWDESVFLQDWDDWKRQNEATGRLYWVYPAVVSQRLYDELQLEEGGLLQVSIEIQDPQDYTQTASVTTDLTVVSIHPGDMATLLLPVNALRRVKGVDLNYDRVLLTIDPAKNRQLDEFRPLAANLIAGGGPVPLRAVYNDQELRQAVIPMEQVISFMKTLYPVTLALSALVAAGVAVLLTLWRTCATPWSFWARPQRRQGPGPGSC